MKQLIVEKLNFFLRVMRNLLRAQLKSTLATILDGSLVNLKPDSLT